MSRMGDHLIGVLEDAGWPFEGMELAMVALDELGTYEHDAGVAELKGRASRACDGWRGCLIAAGEGRGTICHACPLTTMRDANSDECEYGPLEEVAS